MRIWRSRLQGLGGILLGAMLAFALHACQAPTPPTTTTTPTAPAATSPAASAPASLPAETQSIIDRAGANFPNPARGDVRLVVISDLNDVYGSTTYPEEVRLALKLLPFWQPDMVLCSGDMVAGQDPTLPADRFPAMWAGFDQVVAKPLREAGIPYGFTLGNHDASSALGVQGTFLFQREREAAAAFWNDPAHATGIEFVDRFEFPFFYTFKFKDVFFMAWDGSSNHIPAEKLKWVEQALASPAAQSAKLRILVGHLPLYSVAIGRNTPSEVMENADDLRAMLERYNVHTYVSGHHHAYYPGYKGKLQLLHTGILGSGPRPLIDNASPPRKALTVIDINYDAPAKTTYTTYDMQKLVEIKNAELPRYIVGVNGLVLRRDVQWEQLSQSDRALCESRLGAARCTPG